MRVQHIRQAHVLFTAIEFLSELEEMNRDLVVEVQEFAVLTDHIQYDLADFDKERDFRQNTVLLFKLIEVAICQQDKLFRWRIAFLDHDLVSVWVQVTVGQKLRKFFDAFILFNLHHDAVVFLNKVFEYTLKQGHASVLTDVSEKRDILTNRGSVGRFDANVD